MHWRLGDHWRPQATASDQLATWRPGDLATWRPLATTGDRGCQCQSIVTGDFHWRPLATAGDLATWRPGDLATAGDPLATHWRLSLATWRPGAQVIFNHAVVAVPVVEALPTCLVRVDLKNRRHKPLLRAAELE